jgi:hypothetical protein
VSLDQTGRKESIMTDITLAEILDRNRGRDNGVYPNGVPESYSWYRHGMRGLIGPFPPPTGFTAVLGWVVVYPQKGQPSVPCTILCDSYQGYVHKKVGGWAQTQFPNWKLAGGKFVDAISPANIAGPLVITEPDAAGVSSMPSPPLGYMDHFWTAQRGTYPANTVDGYLTFCRLRLSRADAHYVAQMGTDWWRDAGAPFLSDFSNNPGLGSSDWLKLTDQWKWVAFTNITEAMLRQQPPPNVNMTGGVIEPPPIEPPPAIPEGWQLAPKQWTPEMAAAFWQARDAAMDGANRAAYAAAMAAAPKP